jgi:glucosyl-dolichyl phosphate glucuronosyltransferase
MCLDNKLKISVVVCTYGRGAFLFETLSSLSFQSYSQKNYEVVIVDNNPFLSSYILAIISRLKATVFSLHPLHLRYLHCASTGVSHARNLGVSKAKGDIICFIDNDALASYNWLETISVAFAKHPDAGVIGGHIQLKIPSPRPKVLISGFESYWSQLITDYTQYTEVETWDKFPWGANWCARKKCLLEIGGFNTEYGRSGNNFWGGEELVAATLIQRLGYKIAICPQSLVIHDVDIKRYTLKHLFRTFLASKLVRYKAKKDNYL